MYVGCSMGRANHSVAFQCASRARPRVSLPEMKSALENGGEQSDSHLGAQIEAMDAEKGAPT